MDKIKLTLGEAVAVYQWPWWRQAISPRLRIHVLALDARSSGFTDVAEFLEKAESRGNVTSFLVLVLMWGIHAKNTLRHRRSV